MESTLLFRSTQNERKLKPKPQQFFSLYESNSAVLQVPNLKFTFGNSMYPNIEARCAAFSLMFFLWNSLFAMVWALFCSDSQERTAKERKREISVKTTSINRKQKFVERLLIVLIQPTVNREQAKPAKPQYTDYHRQLRDRKGKEVACHLFHFFLQVLKTLKHSRKYKCSRTGRCEIFRGFWQTGLGICFVHSLCSPGHMSRTI